MGLFWVSVRRLSYNDSPILLNFFRIELSLHGFLPKKFYNELSDQEIDMSATLTSTESRALSLLGQGIGPEMVASAIGVSVSRISQLLSDPNFAAEVAELRFRALAKHNERDSAYDSLEDELVQKMKDCLPLMYKPFEILKAIQIINAAKRRGSSAPESITAQQTVVQLLMPTQIFNNFTKQEITVNVNNQVVKAGEQDLVTIQSSSMDRLLAGSKTARIGSTQTTQEANHVTQSLPEGG